MRTVTLPEVLSAAIAAHAEGMHIAIPGRVVAYDAVAQTVDVQPTVKVPLRAGEDGLSVTHAELPTLPAVPVAWPSGGGYFVAFPLAIGDPVMLVFSDVAMGDYLENGEDSAPEDTRRHSAGYPIAIPGGARPKTKAFADAPTDCVLIGKDGTDKQIKITATHIELGKAATDFVALASRVDAELAALKAAFDAHIHPETGTNTLIPTIALTPPAPVGSTLVKVK